jgi:hypothetical protein
VQRTLSVPHTFLLKFVLPPLWIGGFGYGTWQLWLHPGDVLFDRETGAATPALQWLFLVLFAVGILVLLAFVVPLKRVRLEPDGLRVSNYFREITVPFSNIERVRQNWLPTYRLITLDLRTETPLGGRVIFMPAGPLRLAFWRAGYWREDEMVAELRALAGIDQKTSRAAAV